MTGRAINNDVLCQQCAPVRMLQMRTYFIQLPGAGLLYTDLPWILLLLFILLVFFISFHPPAMDTINHPSLVDNVDSSSLPGTDAKDTKNDPSLATTDSADNVDESSLPGMNGIDHDPVRVLHDARHDGDHSSRPEIRMVDNDTPPATKEINHGFPPSGDDGEHNEVVILLVGNKDADKRGVVNSLTRSGAWVDGKIAVDSSKKSCVRIVTSTSLARVIVDTTPLINIKRRSPTMIARRWVSRNCLRRILSGKDVVVVLVVTCKVQKTCKLDVLSKSNCWVDVFCQIFKNHRGAIMILVNTEDQGDVAENIKTEVEQFVQKHGLSPKNITYSNLKQGDDPVRAIFEPGLRNRTIPGDGNPHTTRLRSSNGGENLATGGRRQSRGKTSWQLKRGRSDTNHIHRNQILGSIMPCTINVTPRGRERFGPWGPERVILFGKTGSGKSTLAQMLTSGKLDGMGQTFLTSTGIRGGTTKVQAGEGRGWYVVDTPGLGEPEDDSSTLSTSKVVGLIKRYVRREEGTFSHYICVMKRDRVDLLDSEIWKFFVELFGEEVKRQCSVLVSDANKKWVQDNIRVLTETFEGCESFLSAEFPATNQQDDLEVDLEDEKLRTESLSQLEEDLASLNRFDMFCKYGKYSKTSRSFETDRQYWDSGIERNRAIRVLVGAAHMIFECRSICQRPFSELAYMLREEEVTLKLPR